MRYYNIVVGASPAGSAGATWTNQVQGPNGLMVDMGAPEVHIDAPVAPFATPYGPSGFPQITICGVGLQTISQSSDFNGAPISVYAGMQAGLPLATAAINQAGLIVQGTVYQAYGNWLGVNQTLDLIVQADGGATQGDPANITFSWKKGTPLATAIQQTLTAGFPGMKSNIKISPSLQLAETQTGYFQTIEQFANYVKTASQAILNPTGKSPYPGVDMTITATTFNVFDGTSPGTPKQLQIQDIIGQPTWQDANTINFNTVMRADIDISDIITFPPPLTLQTTTTPSSQAFARNNTAFQGNWQVVMMRHLGNSRSPSATAWVTAFQAITLTAPAISQPSGSQ